MALPLETVRVRFTEDGAPEVLAAFKSIQDASKKTGGSIGSSFANLASALGPVKELLGAIGIAASAGGLVAMAEHAAAATGQIVRMSQTLGTTFARMEALDIAAKTTNTDLLESSRALARFVTGAEAAAHGTGELIKPLRALGFSAAEMRALGAMDVAGQLEAVAKKWAALPTGIEKSTLALELLSARGLKLIPFMQELGTRGLDELSDKAHHLGLTLSDDLAQQINQMNKDFRLLRLASEGAARQFVAGFAPDMRRAIAAVDVAMRDSAENWQVVGAAFATPFILLVGLLSTVGLLLTGLTTSIVHSLTAVGVVTKAIIDTWTLGAHAWDGVGDRVDAEMKRAKSALLDAGKRSVAVWQTLFAPPPGIRQNGSADIPDLEDLYHDRHTKLKAALERELALIKTNARERNEVEAGKFEEGLEDVRAYYNARRQIITQATQQEIAKLRERLAIETAEENSAHVSQVQAVASHAKEVAQGTVASHQQLIPTVPSHAPLAPAGLPLTDQAEGQVERTTQDIKNAQRELAAELAKIDNEERKSIRQLADEKLALDRKVFEARGRQHEAVMLQIQDELRKAKLTLDKSGNAAGSAEDRRQLLETLHNALQLEADFNEQSRLANLEMGKFSRDRAAVDALVSNGLLSQVEGMRRITKLEEDRLPRLRAMAEAMLRIAQTSGDQERVAQALNFKQSVDEIGAAMLAASNDMVKLRASIIDATQTDLANFFANGIHAGIVFGEAMRNLAFSIAQSVQQIVAQMLALQIVTGLLNLAGSLKGPGKLPTGSVEPRQFTSPPAMHPSGFAVGGVVPGVDTGGDSVPALLRAGEFVVRNEVVSRPGMLSHLEGLNRGLAPIARHSYVRRYAEGGLVQTVADSGADPTSFVIGLEEGLVIRHMESAQGQRAQVRTIQKNRDAIRPLVSR